MAKHLKAIYENGVFRPLEPVDLAEHQKVTVTVPERRETPLRNGVSCYDIARQAGIIGVSNDLSEDLGTNPAYF